MRNAISQSEITKPRPLTGYVFYSNYGERAEDTKVPWTRERLFEHLEQRLGIPASDIWVEPFRPCGGVAWTTYIKTKHAAIVSQLRSDFETMFRKLNDIES